MDHGGVIKWGGEGGGGESLSVVRHVESPALEMCIECRN